MPVSRMRMRPWLEKMIESKNIPGLTWVDMEKTMFSIPWKHAARHGWEMDKDACLFKMWAIHTGKYREGQTCDPKTWKANFRCAMNSLPDIEEVKNKSINKGHQAVRIFKMLPATPKSRDKRSQGKEAKLRRKTSMVKTEEDTDFSDTQSPSGASLTEETTQENTVDSTMQTDQLDFMPMNSPEVPNWSYSIDDGLRSFSSNICERFQVSPEHNSEGDSIDEMIEICQLLEEDTHWKPNSTDNMGFLSNELNTSPGSIWSDSSSDDLDEMPHYTTLGSGFTNFTADFLLSPHSTLML